MNQDQDIEVQSKRQGLALCLSGGGYRATLFHLGACQRLNELGLLKQVRSISSVSGGSLLAGFLATGLPWEELNQDPSLSISPDLWEQGIRTPVRQFCSNNIRSGPLFGRILPWNWFGPAAVVRVAQTLEGYYGKKGLKALPPQPNFIFCATDLNFGAYWGFTKAKMGDYQVGWSPPPEEFTIANAAAISACFPPVFAPYRLETRDLNFSDGRADEADFKVAIANLRLNDGGNYDNFGVEAVWKDHQLLLVSDAGAAGKPNPRIGWFELIRFFLVIDKQHRSLRKRLIMDAFSRNEPAGAYWGVGSAPSQYRWRLNSIGLPAEVPGAYPLELAHNSIGLIRTDLDKFSTLEQEVLENHGYAMAEAAVRAYVPQNQIPSPNAPFQLPNEVKSQNLQRDLYASRFTNPLGRGLFKVWQKALDRLFGR